MVHRGDLRSGGDHLLPLLHDQGGGHVGLLGDGVGGQPPLLADLQQCLVGVGVQGSSELELCVLLTPIFFD